MKGLLGILLVSLLLIFSGCSLLGYDAEITKIITDGKSSDCAKLTGETDDKTKFRIDKCYKEFAFGHQDPELCERIVDENKHDDCIVDLAEDLKNIDLCHKVKKGKDECWSKTAIAKNEESLCEGIETRKYKDNCYSKIGEEKASLDICSKIEANFQRSTCVQVVAIKEKNVTACDSLVGGSKDRCIGYVALETKNPELCKGTKDNYNCYTALALVTNNSMLCDKINDEDDLYFCFEKVAKALKNSSICLEIYNKDDKLLCIEEFAKTDPTACNLIENDQTRDSCQQEYGYSI